MKTIFSLLFLIISFAGYAQVPQPSMLWLKSIGGNGSDQVGRHATRTSDGGFILSFGSSSTTGTGTIDSFCTTVSERNIFVKYNQDASISEWSKCYGYTGDSIYAYLFPLNDESVVIGGRFNSASSYGWLIAKHDAAGNLMWQHNYSRGKGSILSAMMATDDGGYIMTGAAYQTDTNVVTLYGPSMTSDIWVLKVDQNGNKVWSKVIGGSGDESSAALVPAPGDGVYVVGGTGSYDHDCTGNPGGGSAYVARLDRDGNKLWHRCLGGSSHDAATAACSNSKGGVILAVNTRSSDHDVHNHHGGSDYWAVEVDSAGAIVWDNCYGTASDDVPQAICKTTSGAVWINGYSTDNYDDVFIVHADSAGNLFSSTFLKSSSKERGQMIHALPDGLVLVGGYFSVNSADFSTLVQYGAIDVFLATYAPWNVSVENYEKTKDSFRIYPNPAGKLLYVERSSKKLTVDIVVTDMAGRRVHEINLPRGEHKIAIDVSGFAKGAYNVQVSGNGGVITKKILIQ